MPRRMRRPGRATSPSISRTAISSRRPSTRSSARPPRAAAPNGLLLQHGRIVASWGDTRRVDMTFSVAKSYLSLLAGLAVADGLIGDLDEPIGRTVRDGGFDGPHNGAITWRHMLQQVSEWEGTLWDKPDQIDRNRQLGAEGKAQKGDARPLQPPGSYWEYNDVRVNRLQPRFAAPVRARAAGGVRRADHAADRRLLGMALGGISQFLARARRQARAIGLGRRPLGRRRVHPRRGPGADRAADAAPRDVGRAAADRCRLDRAIAGALRAEPAYGFMWWLNTDRAKYPSGLGRQLLRARRRRQRHLGRARDRHGGGSALDRSREAGRVPRRGGGGARVNICVLPVFSP